MCELSCVGRRRAGREEAGVSAQPKTRTPHKDVGKNEEDTRARYVSWPIFEIL